MNWKNYKIYTIGKITRLCWIGIFVFVLPHHFVQSCGPSEIEFYGYSFINPKLVNTKADYAPYLLQFEDFYESAFDQEKVQLVDNVSEWQTRTCEDASKEDIAQIIYKASIRSLEVIRTAAKSRTLELPTNLSKNSFAAFLEEKQCIETIDYLIFAKECEPHVVAPANAWDAPKRDTVSMNNLIEAGIKKFRKTDSHYIRLRYAYQIIRLAHYKKNYQHTIDLWELLTPKIDAHPSIIDYWILGHKAGAMREMGQHVEASYLFSLIFQHSPSKRASAYRSFLIKTDEEWQKCLELCQSDTERAVLYTIRANNNEALLVEEMEHIYRLDPDNEHLEILLIKEIRRLEKDHLGYEFNQEKRKNKRFYKIPRKEGDHFLIRLQQLIHKIIKDDTIHNIDLWRIADAYLEVLAGDYYAAEKSFLKLEGTIKDEKLLEQFKVFKLALDICQLDEIDNEDEDVISNIIRKNEQYKANKDFAPFLFDKLAYDYSQQDEIGKAFRSQYTTNDLKYNLPIGIIEDLISICKKEEHSKLERALISKNDGSSILNDLLDMKGNYYFAQHQLEAAAEIYRELPVEILNQYQVNPFTERIKDCVHCGPRDTTRYNKVQLIDEMLKLKYEGYSDAINGPEAFYELGLAHYNMTFYGNAWDIIDYFRSGSNWGFTNEKNKYYLYDTPYGNVEYKDCSEALFYFEKARLLAKDKELGAKAAFMAAKCEQNMWFNSEDCTYSYWTGTAPNVPPDYRRYFQLLRDHYNDTEVYKRVIAECKFFQLYALK